MEICFTFYFAGVVFFLYLLNIHGISIGTICSLLLVRCFCFSNESKEAKLNKYFCRTDARRYCRYTETHIGAYTYKCCIYIA